MKQESPIILPEPEALKHNRQALTGQLFEIVKALSDEPRGPALPDLSENEWQAELLNLAVRHDTKLNKAKRNKGVGVQERFDQLFQGKLRGKQGDKGEPGASTAEAGEFAKRAEAAWDGTLKIAEETESRLKATERRIGEIVATPGLPGKDGAAGATGPKGDKGDAANTVEVEGFTKRAEAAAINAKTNETNSATNAAQTDADKNATMLAKGAVETLLIEGRRIIVDARQIKADMEAVATRAKTSETNAAQSATAARTALADAQRANQEQQRKNRRNVKYIIGAYILGGVALAASVFAVIYDHRTTTSGPAQPVGQSDTITIPNGSDLNINSGKIVFP